MSLISTADLLSEAFAQHVLPVHPDEGFIFVELLTNNVLKKVLHDHVLFALPLSSPRMRAYYLPNPLQRFCIPLKAHLRHTTTPPPSSSSSVPSSSTPQHPTDDIVDSCGSDIEADFEQLTTKDIAATSKAAAEGSINWFRNNKLRKYLSQFDLVIKQDLTADLLKAAAYHSGNKDGTWLTKGFIAQLNDLANVAASSSDRRFQMYSFSLIEKESHEVTATTFGFASGGIFEDYTMATFKRDKRSCGAILNRLVGYLLQEAGFTLWYWGYEIGYMSEYCEHYHARNFLRPEFYQIHHQVRNFEHKPFDQIELPFGVKVIFETKETRQL